MTVIEASSAGCPVAGIGPAAGSPPIGPERSRRQPCRVVEIRVERVVAPRIAHRHRRLHLVAPDDHAPVLDPRVRPDELPVGAGDTEPFGRTGSGTKAR